jgi:hypothetical protein
MNSRSRRATCRSLDAVQERVYGGPTALDPVRKAVAAGGPIVGGHVDCLRRATFDPLSLDAAAFQRTVLEHGSDRRPCPATGLAVRARRPVRASRQTGDRSRRGAPLVIRSRTVPRGSRRPRGDARPRRRIGQRSGGASASAGRRTSAGAMLEATLYVSATGPTARTTSPPSSAAVPSPSWTSPKGLQVLRATSASPR